ncbi:carbohydrate ABC transporter membrane protein 2 (CUT1 family) [Saccharothrix saharensis]|uniref:Carbohydrate ABC transporter membrane protein 2 (CUT1 family) n=1 Tax=Saccharothrix saharensis TaxID=571190 RepID=A0A543J7L2_9PSEU|nr:carbohydrate ABC transporter permease [Saccharothrix saharensis]TQM78788.1 carbohydrate ABC transporter membrane protein 2 (CUT1 family) [Saccharothrix saharensis]
MSRDRVERAVFAVLRPVVIVGFLIATLLPFYAMLVLSLRPIEDLLRRPGSLAVDLSRLTLDTYVDVLRPVAEGGQGFLGLVGNSAVVATASVVVALLIAVPGAYAVSRLDFFGRRHVSSLFLVVYLFPAIVLAIPLFVLLTQMQLRGSLVGLVLVYIAQTVPVAIYMLKNYFATIPASVEEAGLVDGLGRVGVIRRISLPLALPSVVATGTFVFMIAWNEFLFALLFLVERRDRWTVSLGLAQLSGSIEVPTTVLMAGSVVITLPVVLLFFLTERLLSQGLTSGAEKG